MCPTRYQTRHFFNNSNTNEDIATKFEQQYVRCVRNKEECVCSETNCCGAAVRQPASLFPVWRAFLLICHLAEGAALLFLMGISERESLPKQTTNHRWLESKHHRRYSDSDSGRTGKDFPKYGASGSILSGRKWWPLPARGMMSSHFLRNEVSPLKFRCNIVITGKIIKEMPGSVASGTLCIFAQSNQQDAAFHNLFISVRRSTCFRRLFCPSSGAQNCTYRPLLLPAASLVRLRAGSSNGLTNTWRYMCSFEILMMDRKSVWNMLSVLQK